MSWLGLAWLGLGLAWLGTSHVVYVRCLNPMDNERTIQNFPNLTKPFLDQIFDAIFPF